MALHPCGEKEGKHSILFVGVGLAPTRVSLGQRVGASPTPTKACFPRKDAEDAPLRDWI